MTLGNQNLDTAVDDAAAHLVGADEMLMRRIAVDLRGASTIGPDEDCAWVVPVHEDLACDDRVLGDGAIAAIRSVAGVVPGLVVAMPDRTVLAVLDEGEVTCDEIRVGEQLRAHEVWVELGDRRYLGLELVIASADGPWRRLMYVDGPLQDAATLAAHDRLVSRFVERPRGMAGQVVRRCATCGTFLDPDESCLTCAPPSTAGPMAAAQGAAGAWHPDPWGRYELRFYDGQGWTAHVSSGGATGIDAGAQPPRASTDPGPPIQLWAPVPGPQPAADPTSRTADTTRDAAPEPSTVTSSSTTTPTELLEQLERLTALRAAGGITDDEFAVLKAAILVRA